MGKVMIKEIVIEWNYEPKDFFEAEMVIKLFLLHHFLGK